MTQPEGKQMYKIMIDQKPYEVADQFITGAQIKALAHVPANYGVWLKVTGPRDDEEILDNDEVDLSEPGREHFFTGSKSTTEG